MNIIVTPRELSTPWWWVYWKKPTKITTYVLNCDGSFKQKKYGSSAYILRSSQGVPLLAASMPCPVNGLPILFHEAKAILDGIIEVTQSFPYIEELEIRSDSRSIINAINQNDADFRTVFGAGTIEIIYQIRRLTKEKLKSYKFVWVEREANLAADFLAKIVNKKRSKRLRYENLDKFPDELKIICRDDSNNIGRVRTAKTPNMVV
ncbi:hypothetical protein M9H77_28664 [Catharanthus roseus]|uniref:Uncharacterized protein n=1 Tax=Catharanthus roseus TaxID=4058 RepID=A0ACC0AGZ2_CATRO|nr:hypothetical protein M9H77_28664 [Catharanthus roseus]